jgi:hypothetical protein
MNRLPKNRCARLALLIMIFSAGRAYTVEFALR